MSCSRIKIAIVGAGPVGTTLARLLLLHCPSASVTVFESDASPDYRSQGGTLDLHTNTGLAALKEANLWNEFLQHARYDGESLKITDKHLKVYHSVKPTGGPDAEAGRDSSRGGQRPEIDRGALRKMLMESLPDGVVQWGHKLKEIRFAAGDGSQPTDHQLVFTMAVPASPSEEREVVISGFDLIVGADGGWSKIRSQGLNSTKPYSSHIVWHELKIPDASHVAPEVYALVNRGSVFAQADHQRIALQQLGDGSIQVAVLYRVEDEALVSDVSREDLLERLRVEGWHPLIRQAVAQAQGKTAVRWLYMLPVPFRWAHRHGVTAVGDAAHLMTPFAGEGVNVGMQDARLLARSIQRAGEDTRRLDDEVAAFEEDMFTRAGAFQQLTLDLMNHWFCTVNSPAAVMPKVEATMARFHDAQEKVI